MTVGLGTDGSWSISVPSTGLLETVGAGVAGAGVAAGFVPAEEPHALSRARIAASAAMAASRSRGGRPDPVDAAGRRCAFCISTSSA